MRGFENFTRMAVCRDVSAYVFVRDGLLATVVRQSRVIPFNLIYAIFSDYVLLGQGRHVPRDRVICNQKTSNGWTLALL